MSDVKIRSQSQQKLCNDLNRIVQEYTTMFQSLSSFDLSKEIVKCANSFASEEKIIDNTSNYSKIIRDSLTNLNKVLETSLEAMKPKVTNDESMEEEEEEQEEETEAQPSGEASSSSSAEPPTASESKPETENQTVG